MIEECRIVKLNKKQYAVLLIAFNDTFKLAVIDAEDVGIITRIGSWNYSQSGGYLRHTVYVHFNEKQIIYGQTTNKLRREIYMHNLVMGLINFPGKGAIRTVDHINRIGMDNRKANLRFVTQTKQNYNQKKKKRTVNLPEGCGIDSNELPTCVEYQPGSGAHGDRFVFYIKKNNKKIHTFRSTKSKGKSLRYKLEQVKQHISELKIIKPELFEDRCFNGEYTEEAKVLIDEYNEILKLSQFDCANKFIVNYKTEDYLEDNIIELSEEEQKCLNKPIQLLSEGRRQDSKLPENFKAYLPKYCYYTPAKGNRGDKFTIERHPSLKKRQWSTSGSQKISTNVKYNALIDKYNELQKIANEKCDYPHYSYYSAEEIIIAKKKSNNLSIKKYKNHIKSKENYVSNLPENCGIKSNDIPPLCHYKTARGGSFAIKDHPGLSKLYPNDKKKHKFWQTSTSKKISIIDKYNSLIKQYNLLQDVVGYKNKFSLKK